MSMSLSFCHRTGSIPSLQVIRLRTGWVPLPLQEQERLETFSSIYSGEASSERLEMIASLGFASEEMTRRIALLNRRREASAAHGLDVI